MTPKVQYFIEDHIWEIDHNLFAALYQVLIEDENFSGYDISEFTQALYAAGIDPVLYMDQIPPAFMFGNTRLKKVDIEEGTISIMYSAYQYCADIEEIILPQSMDEIEWDAFIGCTRIKRIVIKNPNITIDDSAFEEMTIDEIEFNGTRQEFENLSLRIYAEIVRCHDGDIKTLTSKI